MKKDYNTFTYFIPRTQTTRAVQYDGNYRCLDVFPFNATKLFKSAGKNCLSYDGEIIHPGDYIVEEKENVYKIMSEEEFNKKYVPAPEEIMRCVDIYFCSTRIIKNKEASNGTSR